MTTNVKKYIPHFIFILKAALSHMYVNMSVECGRRYGSQWTLP